MQKLATRYLASTSWIGAIKVEAQSEKRCLKAGVVSTRPKCFSYLLGLVRIFTCYLEEDITRQKPINAAASPSSSPTLITHYTSASHVSLAAR